MKRNSSIKIGLSGCLMGISEVIPGVSGGTMAVLLNIYDRFIGSISNIKKDFKNSITFLIPLIIGMALGIFAFSFIITYLNSRFPLEVNFLFLGLVIGLFPMILQKSVAAGFRFTNMISFFVLLICMCLLSYFSLSANDTTAIITSHTVGTAIKFALVGCLAAVCMILPGVSGSMIMLIFGIYFSVLQAIKTLNIIFLIPLAVGVVIGILFGAKLVDISLKRFPSATYFGILGLLVGSTLTIFSNQTIYISKYVLDITAKNMVNQYNFSDFKMLLIHSLISILVLCGGFFVSYCFTKKESTS